MPRPHRSPVVLVVLVSTFVAAPSRAAPPEAVERARKLFLQAEADEDADRWSEALEKLRAVSLVRLTAGVRYHIALCEQQLGRLALALRDYRAAEQQANADNAKDVLRTVGRDLAALESRVPRIMIRVTPALPDTAVNLDGEPIGDALAGAPIPVDPGVHYVEVRAPGRLVSTQAVTLQERESRTLEVTLAAPAPSGSRPRPGDAGVGPSTPNPPAPAQWGERPPALSTEASAPAPPRAHRTAALIATAVSVGLAGGGVLAFLASGVTHEHAVRECSSVVTRAADACDSLRAPVRAWDWVAGGSWAAAVAAGGVAVVLWTKHAEASSSAANSRSAGIGVILGPATLGAGGRF
jgi:hypothetical protein